MSQDVLQPKGEHNMSRIQVFSHSHFGKIEVAVIDGKKHIEAIPCAKALGYANPRKAIIDHCRYVTKRDVPHPQSPNKTIEKNFIPEGDLYRLIVRSNLPEAELFERWVFDKVLPSIMETGYYISAIELARRDEQVDRLEDELHLLRQQVAGLRNGHGSFQLWDVAQQFRKNGIGDGNTHKTVQMLIEHGLLLKDTSVKKRGLYRPFLKDIRAGYFDHELTNNGQPVPVWQSQITVTAKGMDWIINTFLSLRNKKWAKERPMIGYSREVQRRIAGLSPEVGGAVLVNDPCGSRVVWVD